jgi:hypothetical protein
VVKRVLQTLNEVAADDREAHRRLLLNLYADAVAASVVVDLGDVSVGFALDERSRLVCEGHQVLIRPVELGVDAV